MAEEVSQRRKIMGIFFKNRTAIIGAIITLIIILMAIFAPWISPHDPLEQDVYHRLTPPEHSHPLGTDMYGRGVFSRVLRGMQISLLVGILSVLGGMIIGAGVGMVGAYKGGKVEAILMRAIDILMSFPDEVLGIMIMIVLGSGLFNVILTITILMIPRFARLAHAPTLAVKEEDYITATISVGANDLRTIARHVLPNIFGEILVMSTLWLGTAIRVEASLSFLGMGVAPPTPTLGGMIRDGVDYLGYAPWVSLFPGLAILIIVFAFNMIGDGLRDITDPKLYT
ncbi:MAG: ABC transporter permease [Candidatus Aerophobetes bacterium]|nr:ABC transporter permease [Candidatus Aerophobetes bacterium]